MPVIPTPSTKLAIDHANSAIDTKMRTNHVNRAALFNATPINNNEEVINLIAEIEDNDVCATTKQIKNDKKVQQQMKPTLNHREGTLERTH